jgi:hypothetical protein
MIGQRMHTSKALRYVVLTLVSDQWCRIRGFARLEQAEAYINKRPDEMLYIQDMRE